ncbi:class I adenylate-forming enzyme family protein [Actinomadura macrotermitis]|uniref:Long-chain-fatty-acid--CoA ligase n=1 Tax=Actinomadura macrotermitis TaxID=2585200 RepID=A0A7K0BN30_9ACTN|nr:AMP-binding protein [Actinomadura macrotermitis]MQY02580.1 Long-chain-fatty-acid--CoA ligase [Actinomadura macrotermitis]
MGATSPQLTLDYPDVPVGAILTGAAHRWGDRTALHYMGRDISYTELAAEAARFAGGLLARGIGRGDVVALHLPNVPEFAIAYYGTLLAGATFSPCNPLLPPDDLAFQLADCGAVAVVTLDLVAASVAAALDRTKVRTVVLAGALGPADPAQVCDGAFAACGVAFGEIGAGQPAEPPAVEIDTRRDLAHIAYTGGTTGRSKGVMLPHRNVVVNVLQFACAGAGAVPAADEHGLRVETAPDDPDYPVPLGEGVLVNVAPWFHAMGTVGYLSNLLIAGTKVIVHPRLDVPAFLDDMERFGATALGGAPALFSALLADPSFAGRDLSSVQAVRSGAAPLSHEMIARLREAFPAAVVVEAYGLTEVTMGATANPAALSGVRKIGTVGPPVADTRVKVVAVDEPAVTDATPGLPAGQEGEVCIKGPQVMTGYLNRPEETAAVLGADGWLRTGDIGALDEDGYLAIVDRKKDMLLYKGYNVYPRELEEKLFAHPAVANAAVVGRPDATAGELPTAFVVRSGEVGEDELIEYVNAQVVHYKRLREVRFVDEIPVSAAGKILKRELRDRL